MKSKFAIAYTLGLMRIKSIKKGNFSLARFLQQERRFILFINP